MTGALRCEPLPGLVVFALAADFPQPLGPTRPVIDPSGTAMSTPSSTGAPPG